MPTATAHQDKENLVKKRSSLGTDASSRTKPLPRVATLSSSSTARANGTAGPAARSSTPSFMRSTASSSTASGIGGGASTSTRPASVARQPITATKAATIGPSSARRSLHDGAEKTHHLGSSTVSKATASPVTAPKVSTTTLKRLSTQKSTPINEKGPRLAAHIRAPPSTPAASTKITSPKSPTHISKFGNRDSGIGSPVKSRRNSSLLSTPQPESDGDGRDEDEEGVSSVRSQTPEAMTRTKPQVAGGQSPSRRPTGPRVGLPPPVSAANLATFHDARYLTQEEQRIVRAFREDSEHIVFKRLADEEDHTFGQVVEDMELNAVTQLNDLTKIADERMRTIESLKVEIDGLKQRFETDTTSTEPAEESPMVSQNENFTDEERSRLIEEHRLESENYREQIQSLQKEAVDVAALNEQLRTYQQSLMSSQRERDSLQAEVSELQKFASDKQAESEDMKTQLSSLSGDLAAKKGVSESDQLVIIKLKHDLMNASQEIARKTEVIERYDFELTELRAVSQELDRLPNGLDGIYRQIADLNNQVANLETSLEASSAQKKVLTERLTAAEDDKGKLSLTAENLQANVTSLTTRLEELVDEHGKEKAMQIHEDGLREREGAEYVRQIKELEQEKGKLSETAKDLQEDVVSLTTRLERLVDEHGKERAMQLQEESRHQREGADYVHRIEELEQEKSKLSEAANDLKEKVDSLEAQHKAIAEEHEKETQENSRQRKEQNLEIGNLLERLRKVEQLSAETTASLEGERRELEQAIESNRSQSERQLVKTRDFLEKLQKETDDEREANNLSFIAREQELTAQIEALQGRLDKANIELQEFETSKTKDQDGWTATFQNLQDTEAFVRKELEDAKMRTTTLEARYQVVEAREAKLLENKSALEGQIAQFQQTINTLQTAKVELEAELASAEINIDNPKAASTDMRGLQAEYEKLMAQFETAQKEIAQLQTGLNDFAAESSERKEAYEKQIERIKAEKVVPESETMAQARTRWTAISKELKLGNVDTIFQFLTKIYTGHKILEARNDVHFDWMHRIGDAFDCPNIQSWGQLEDLIEEERKKYLQEPKRPRARLGVPEKGVEHIEDIANPGPKSREELAGAESRVAHMGSEFEQVLYNEWRAREIQRFKKEAKAKRDGEPEASTATVAHRHDDGISTKDSTAGEIQTPKRAANEEQSEAQRASARQAYEAELAEDKEYREGVAQSEQELKTAHAKTSGALSSLFEQLKSIKLLNNTNSQPGSPTPDS